MRPRRPANAWGLGLVAAAHAALLAVAWAQSLALDPPGTRSPAVLVAQLLALAEPAPEPLPELQLPQPAPQAAPHAPAAPALAVPEWSTADASRGEPPPPPDGAAARPAIPAPAAGGPDAAAKPDSAHAPGTALASARPAAPAPAAPRRSPAGHAGCADVPHPLALRERGIEGLVQLRVQVGSDGRARQVQLLGSSGWRLFDEAALAKARSCRFRPAFEGDTAVESWVEFPVRFALTQS